MYYLKTSIYDAFKCIADKCKYTCCGGWKIAVDEEVAKKYLEIGVDMNYDEESNLILMPKTEDDNCYLLDSCGLCEIVKTAGDELLSYTCRMYPRIFTEYDDCIDMYVTNSCPAVLDLLKNLNGPLTFVMEDEFNGKMITSKGVNANIEGRNQIIDLLQIAELPLSYRFYLSYLFASKLEKANNKESIRDMFNDVSNILKICESISSVNIDKELFIEYRKFLFVNIPKLFIENKRYKEIYVSTRDALDNLLSNNDYEVYREFEKTIEEYNQFFENFAVNMMFAKGCVSYKGKDSLLYSVIAGFVEITLIKYHLFILWLSNDRKITWDEINLACCFYARNTEHALGSIVDVLDKYMERGIMDDSMLMLLI